MDTLDLPERCKKDLHDKSELSWINQQRNGKKWKALRCRGCTRDAANSNPNRKDYWLNQRQKFAKPHGSEKATSTLWEYRLTDCHHYVMSQGIHLPLFQTTRIWCFRCEAERYILGLEEWDETRARVSHR